jgi:hypothetical protein
MEECLEDEQKKKLQVARVYFRQRYDRLSLEHENEIDKERKSMCYIRLLKCGAVFEAINGRFTSYYPAERIRRIIKSGQKMTEEEIIWQYRILYNAEPKHFHRLLFYLKARRFVKEERTDGKSWFLYVSSMPETEAIMRISAFPDWAREGLTASPHDILRDDVAFRQGKTIVRPSLASSSRSTVYSPIPKAQTSVHQLGTGVARQPRVEPQKPPNKIVEGNPPTPKPPSLSEYLTWAIGNYQHFAEFIEAEQNELLKVESETARKQIHYRIRHFVQKAINEHRCIKQLEESIEKERQQTSDQQSP